MRELSQKLLKNSCLNIIFFFMSFNMCIIGSVAVCLPKAYHFNDVKEDTIP